MKKQPEKLRELVALFRYGLIADVVRRPPGEKGLYAALQVKAAQAYQIPGSTRTCVKVETLRDWMKKYRAGGFEALLPKVRKDHGNSHAIPQHVADKLVEVKEAHRDWSVRMVIRETITQLKLETDDHPAPSTVNRLLQAKGLIAYNAPAPTQDHRRFAFQRAGELWMSDVMHGPVVPVHKGSKVKRKTYLIALIDDATRVVPYAAFCFSENLHSFLPVFKQALIRRGIPLRLFVDNGANYRAHRLSVVCARMDVALIHATPYHPQAKGKQERWFRTVRQVFLSALDLNAITCLEDLNQRLWAWIEGEYHHGPHHGLDGDTPLERWARNADQVRYPSPTINLDDMFLDEAKRVVAKDRTVRLHGQHFEVDASLCGKTILLRFDPAKPTLVQVHDGNRRHGDARPVDVYANCFAKRERHGDARAESHREPSALPLRDLLGNEGEER